MKFVKKPLPIEAIKCTKANEEEIIKLLASGTTEWEPVTDDNLNIVGFNIHSWEGVDPVYYDPKKNTNKSHPNGAEYYIIKGLKGECYPCIKDDDAEAPLGYEPYIERKEEN